MVKAKVKARFWYGKLVGFKWECTDPVCKRNGGNGYARKDTAWHSPQTKIPPLERAIASASSHVYKYHRKGAV
jgi:hypothetical protein